MMCQIEIPDVRVGQLADCALNGGANYWARFQHGERGALIVRDRDTHESWELSDEILRQGLVVMARIAPRHFGDFLAGREDATTGDVFLQCAVLGEVKYG